MKYRNIVGIDVSKEVLDVYLYQSSMRLNVPNTEAGYGTLVEHLTKGQGLAKEEVFVCFEDTGLYSFPLSVYLSEHGIAYMVVPGLEIKRSMGLVRGKDDKVDAERIALYAYRRRDELVSFALPKPVLADLKRLLSLRDKLVKQKAGYEATLGEYRQFLGTQGHALLFSAQEAMIAALSEQIRKINEELDRLIGDDSELKKQYTLLLGIKGIGKQTATYLIAVTEGFSKFKDARSMACFSGIAPFPHRSGSSIMGRSKVSPLANKKIKSLLYTCSMSAIRHDKEMKSYYQRKVSAGKAKMSVLNAVSNKLLARVFAVIKRGTPYVDTWGFCA